MPAEPKPIPALYVVYVLRSTQRQLFYIGSTPNPPRRLRQHNGEVKGGAGRTARLSLRPWEMAALVSGFPGHVAALRFEWALDHPHLTTHISTEDRVSKRVPGTARRKPPKTMASILANLHLLLRAPSFSRWPLALRFFSPDMHAAWVKMTAALPPASRLRTTIPVLTDFGPSAPPLPLAAASSSSTTTNASVSPSSRAVRRDVRSALSPRPRPPSPPPTTPRSKPAAAAAPPNWGIHALPLDHEPLRAYVSKAHAIFAFERAGSCAVCHEPISPQGGAAGLYAVCPCDSCEAVGHLTCWGRHLLDVEQAAVGRGGVGRRTGTGGSSRSNRSSSDRAWVARQVLPICGPCPACRGEVDWADMMKELTLRTRAPNEASKLLLPGSSNRGSRKAVCGGTKK